MKRVMTSLSMLIFVLVLNSCEVETKPETDALLIPKMVFVKGGIIEGEDYPWAPPKGNFPNGRLVQLSDFYIGKYEITQEQYYSVMWDQKVTVKGIDGVKFQLEPNPSYCQADSDVYHSFEGEIQEKRPVEGITWFKLRYLVNTKILQV